MEQKFFNEPGLRPLKLDLDSEFAHSSLRNCVSDFHFSSDDFSSNPGRFVCRFCGSSPLSEIDLQAWVRSVCLSCQVVYGSDS